jgi:Domain of unknown function (DUF1707)
LAASREAADDSGASPPPLRYNPDALADQTPAVRASDAERDQTVALLRRHAVSGRLALEEFAHRMDLAYAARTRAELEALTHDLPTETQPRKRRRAKWLTGVVFGSAERKGRWRLPRFALLGVLFGDADIDLRKAEIGGPVVTITALILFGNADFYVPTGVDVDLGGFAVFGHRGEHGEEVEPAPDAPLVRIRVFSLFGTSDVWHVRAEVRGTYRELIRSVRRRKELGA